MFDSLIWHAGLLVGPAATPQVHLRGLIKGSQIPLRTAYSGSAATLRFLAFHLFSDANIAALSEQAKSHRAGDRDIDLFVCERSPLRSALLAPASDIRIPAWISQSIDLTNAHDGAQTLFSRHLRREVERHTRRSDYTLAFQSGNDSIRRFFRDMYRPYVMSRFQDEAVSVSEEVFLQRSAEHTLACLHSHGEWIAGMLLERSGDALKLGWFGARSDPPPAGASEVLDALVITWAAAQGLRTVVMGHSRPSLSDGVVRYKRRFGATIRATSFPQPQIFLRIVNGSDALARCLDTAALIRVRAGVPLVHRAQIHEARTLIRLETLPNDAA